MISCLIMIDRKYFGTSAMICIIWIGGKEGYFMSRWYLSSLAGNVDIRCKTDFNDLLGLSIYRGKYLDILWAVDICTDQDNQKSCKRLWSGTDRRGWALGKMDFFCTTLELDFNAKEGCKLNFLHLYLDVRVELFQFLRDKI